MKRRTLLTGAAALAALPLARAWGAARSSDGFIELRAGPATAKLLGPDSGPAALWAYNGSAPGPALRVRRGERLKVRLSNALPQASTIHWHGIRIANAMDGVAGLTQAPVPADGTFDYDFVLPDAGTYWYHPHNRSWEQVARGLYGALVVEEDEPYPVDRDETLVIDDWLLTDEGALHEASFQSMHDWSHGGRLGNWVTINGVSTPAIELRKTERVRLRLINTCNARTLRLSFGALEPSIIALDGQPLASARRLASSDHIVLASAQRADLLLDVRLDPGEKSEILALTRDQKVPIGRFDCVGVSTAGLAESELVPLPSNTLPEADLGSALAVELLMQGGAMGRMQSAVYEGERLDIRELVRRGKVWAFNGVAGRTDEPLFDIERGRTVTVNLLNDTSWPHGIHFHGHHFRTVQSSNPDRLLGALRDTVLVERGESLSIAMVADNPGNWMIHCHMLEHQASGMATWFRVRG